MDYGKVDWENLNYLPATEVAALYKQTKRYVAAAKRAQENSVTGRLASDLELQKLQTVRAITTDQVQKQRRARAWSVVGVAFDFCVSVAMFAGVDVPVLNPIGRAAAGAGAFWAAGIPMIGAVHAHDLKNTWIKRRDANEQRFINFDREHQDADVIPETSGQADVTPPLLDELRDNLEKIETEIEARKNNRSLGRDALRPIYVELGMSPSGKPTLDQWAEGNLLHELYREASLPMPTFRI